jgi:predicted nucleotidyltransferase
MARAEDRNEVLYHCGSSHDPEFGDVQGAVRIRMARTDTKMIRMIRDTIVSKYHPQLVILFGSRASGRSSSESDYDILIVKRTRQRDIDRIREVNALFGIRDFGLDVIVRTPAEIRQRMKNKSPLYTEIFTNGKVLYASR